MCRIRRPKSIASDPFAAFVLFALLMALFPVNSQGQSIALEQQWMTYLGGGAEDRVLDIATDEYGHIYVAGRTGGGLTLGNDTTDQSGLTHQEAFGGGASDAFLAKIAPQGSVLWCTYFGGQDDDEGVRVVVHGMDGVFLVGNTTSSTGIATDSSSQSTSAGGTDVFLARFTEYGLLQGCTYMGGPENESVTGATLDALGRPVICGWSDGPSLFADAGIVPLQPWNAGTDGFAATFLSTDSLLRGTYIGGAGQDTLVRLVAKDSTGFYFLGQSSSTDLYTPDADQPAPAGGLETFVLRTDTLFATIIGTWFGGPMDEVAGGIITSSDGIAICGTTWSDSLATDTSAYQMVNAGGSDGFIAVFSEDLVPTWVTFIGDSMDDRLLAIACDLEGNLYASGQTGSPSHIASGLVPDTTLNGTADGFVVRFNTGDSLDWSSYVGSTDDEDAGALCIVGNTSVLVGGRTSSSSGFTLLGHQMDFGGGANDGYAGRLNQTLSTACTGICTGTSTSNGYGSSCDGVSSPLVEYHVCLGDPVTFIVYGGALGIGAHWMWYADGCGLPEYFLTSGDTITFNPTASFMLSVRAESVHGVTSCSNLPIVVHDYPQPMITVSDTVCVGTEVLMNGTGAESFAWSVGDSLIAAGNTASYLSLVADTLIIEVICTNGPSCSVTVEEPVLVLPAPGASWSITNITCAGGSDGSLQLDTASISGVQVSWITPGLEGTFLEALGSGSYIVVLTDIHGCSAMDTLWIAEPPPLIDSVSTSDALCGAATGAAVLFTTSTATGLTYDWGDGPTSMASISGLPPGSYSVAATDSAGCQEAHTFIINTTGTIVALIAADTIAAPDGQGVLTGWCVPSDSLASYLWSPPTGLDDPTSATTACSTNGDMTYVLTITSPAGCSASDSVVVRAIWPPMPISPDPCGEAFLPDNFSPNDDGLNDRLCALGGCYLSLSLNIYDRWGGRVFSTTHADTCWDGTHLGQAVPPGPYAYTFTADRTGGEHVERTGILNVKR